MWKRRIKELPHYGEIHNVKGSFLRSIVTLQVLRVKAVTPKWFRITIEERTCAVAEKIHWLEKGVLSVFWTWRAEAQVTTGPQVFKPHVKKKKVLVTQSFPTLCEPMDYSPPLSIEFSRQEYWSGLLLQGIFLIQECTQILYPLKLPLPGKPFVKITSPKLYYGEGMCLLKIFAITIEYIFQIISTGSKHASWYFPIDYIFESLVSGSWVNEA